MKKLYFIILFMLFCIGLQGQVKTNPGTVYEFLILDEWTNISTWTVNDVVTANGPNPVREVDRVTILNESLRILLKMTDIKGWEIYKVEDYYQKGHPTLSKGYAGQFWLKLRIELIRPIKKVGK